MITDVKMGLFWASSALRWRIKVRAQIWETWFISISKSVGKNFSTNRIMVKSHLRLFLNVLIDRQSDWQLINNWITQKLNSKSIMRQNGEMLATRDMTSKIYDSRKECKESGWWNICVNNPIYSTMTPALYVTYFTVPDWDKYQYDILWGGEFWVLVWNFGKKGKNWRYSKSNVCNMTQFANKYEENQKITN